MFCVIFNPAAPAGAGPLMVARRAGAAQEEKRSATRTTAGNPNVRNFTITFEAHIATPHVMHAEDRLKREKMLIEPAKEWHFYRLSESTSRRSRP